MNNALTAAPDPGAELSELGEWLGQHRAFAAIACKCSAADAECLRKIRADKLYRRLGLTWEEFCRQHAGLDKKTADQIISRLEEFGESYFNLTSILTIRPAGYRAIAPAVSENAIEFEGERIAIEPANAGRLSGAVRALRERSREASPAHPADQLTEIHNRLSRCLSELDALMDGDLREVDRIAVCGIVQHLNEWIGRRKAAA